MSDATIEGLTSHNPNRAAPSTARLLVSCKDEPGIVQEVTRLLRSFGCNIIESHQHTTDPWGGNFSLRIEFAHFLTTNRFLELSEEFDAALGGYQHLVWGFSQPHRAKRIVMMVSKADHALVEILWRWRRGELDADIQSVISNHPDLRGLVESFGLPFHHVPVTRETKHLAEQKVLDLIEGHADLLILARYMQILSNDFLGKAKIPVINIHHSFFPACDGAGPYEQAKQRGVKLIGATAHYVTEELYAGPIIGQDVACVTHSHSAKDMARIGAGIEREVLARALQLHCEDRVIIDGATTVVFQ